jgi:hypothetical protein
MTSSILKILLIGYSLYALLKFLGFFLRSDSERRRGLDKIYVQGNGSIVRFFDEAILVMMLLLVALLFASGIEYLSFTTGLLVGMTLIQVYFHRFSAPLTTEQMPEPPLTALKMMSYSIQANPGKAWREITLISLLLLWSLYMLASRGFGLFS